MLLVFSGSLGFIGVSRNSHICLFEAFSACSLAFLLQIFLVLFLLITRNSMETLFSTRLSDSVNCFILHLFNNILRIKLKTLFNKKAYQ